MTKDLLTGRLSVSNGTVTVISALLKAGAWEMSISYKSVWNFTGGMNSILPKNIPSFGVLLLLVQGLTRRSKSPIDVQLGRDLMTRP